MNNSQPTPAHHLDQPVVLVADDEALVCNLIRDVLTDADYYVLTASDGQQALQISRQFPGRIDILVSDVRMPNLDGIALNTKLLSERPDIKIILISSHLDCLNEDVPFLAKPFEPHILLDRVRGLLPSRP